MEESIRGHIKAVIFDLDGTLVDSEPNYFKASQKALAEYGVVFDAAMNESYVGMGVKNMMEDIKINYNLDVSVEAMVNRGNECYAELACANTAVFPEMLVFLNILKTNRYPLALASGSSPEVIDLVLKITELRPFFDVVLSAEEVRYGKPEPDIFLAAADQLGVLPEHCLVLEDSRFGVEAANRAGMTCIALPANLSAHEQAVFGKADLLMKAGIGDFSAKQAFQWLQAVER